MLNCRLNKEENRIGRGHFLSEFFCWFLLVVLFASVCLLAFRWNFPAPSLNFFLRRKSSRLLFVSVSIAKKFSFRDRLWTPNVGEWPTFFGQGMFPFPSRDRDFPRPCFPICHGVKGRKRILLEKTWQKKRDFFHVPLSRSRKFFWPRGNRKKVSRTFFTAFIRRRKV